MVAAAAAATVLWLFLLPVLMVPLAGQVISQWRDFAMDRVSSSSNCLPILRTETVYICSVYKI